MGDRRGRRVSGIVAAPASAELRVRDEDGHALSLLVWRFTEPRLAVSTAACGGGFGLRRWVVNAQVARDYARTDLAAHARELANLVAATGDGVTMLTAVDVRLAQWAEDAGVAVSATVGVTDPAWAAAAPAALTRPVPAPGTINIVVQVPVPMAPGGLVNLVATATEAKAQALAEAGVPGTGTPSDAVTVVCPAGAGPAGAGSAGAGPSEPFGGPRSEWGARVARAVHRAVAAGLADGGLAGGGAAWS